MPPLSVPTTPDTRHPIPPSTSSPGLRHLLRGVLSRTAPVFGRQPAPTAPAYAPSHPREERAGERRPLSMSHPNSGPVVLSRGSFSPDAIQREVSPALRAQRARNRSPVGTKYSSLGQSRLVHRRLGEGGPVLRPVLRSLGEGGRPPPQVRRPKTIPSLFFHPVWRAPPSARQTGWKKERTASKDFLYAMWTQGCGEALRLHA